MIRKRGNKYTISVELPRGPDGQRRRNWYTAKTKKEALRRQAELQHQVARGSFVEPSRMTVKEFLTRWLRDYAKSKVNPKTFERYTQLIDHHLIPAFGSMRLSSLQPIHVSEFYSQAPRSGRKDGRGGLSAQSVVHLHRVLRCALGQAVKWQLLVRNPCDSVEPPKIERKEMETLTEAETAWLLTAAEGTRLYVPIVLETTLGIRRGEVFGLKWVDTDFESRLAIIRRSLQQTRDRLTFKTPKNGKGRAVTIPQFTVDVLREHRQKENELKAMFGNDYVDSDLICPLADGRPWPPDWFSSEFRRFRKKLGLKVRYHDLRHTHATQLLQQGVHPKVVSERLGHSSVQITLDIYSHVLPTLQEEAAQLVDAALRGAIQKQRKALI